MKQKILDGILLDEQTELSLNDICQACSSSAEWVIELVEEGALDPIRLKSVTTRQTQWRFTGDSLKKARTAMRLQRDLGVNLAGTALALDLLDEIETLQARLRRIDAQDES